MMTWLRVRWMKARALTCLQLAYEVPLKEPLAPDKNHVLLNCARLRDGHGRHRRRHHA